MSLFKSFSQILGSKQGTPSRGAQRQQPRAAQPAPGKPKSTDPEVKVKNGQKPAVPAPVMEKPVAVSPADTKQAQNVIAQAEARAREILIEAKSQALHLREQAEQESRELQTSLVKQQEALERQLSNLDRRLEQVDRREENLDRKVESLDKDRHDLEEKRDQLVAELEKLSGLTRDQAKQELLEQLERTVDRQAAQMIQQKVAAAQEEADTKAKEILVDAMKHGATDYVSEYTISSVRLEDPEMKGRIIGKDGRNIRAFERITGVDVDLDENPNEIRLSSFDSVRREIARVSLERLLKDGRIQPTRIEEVVAKVTSEINKIMFEEGKKMCHAVGIYNLPHEIVGLLGRFKYRFSYGQNLIQHTLEETQIGIKLASELGLDVRTVTLGCLLHDIGKVVEGEGNHVELGVQYLKKFRLPQEVIDCVAQHHEDEPFSSLESVVVYISDAISGSRPGARNENHEEYVKRLSKLEEIADGYDGVKKSFAIQAGREVRVLLIPEKTTDRDPQVLAQKIAERYENEMQYPGTVTVNVIRENRASAVAK